MYGCLAGVEHLACSACFCRKAERHRSCLFLLLVYIAAWIPLPSTAAPPFPPAPLVQLHTSNSASRPASKQGQGDVSIPGRTDNPFYKQKDTISASQLATAGVLVIVTDSRPAFLYVSLRSLLPCNSRSPAPTQGNRRFHHT